MSDARKMFLYCSSCIVIIVGHDLSRLLGIITTAVVVGLLVIKLPGEK